MLRGAVRVKDVLPLLVRAQEEGANGELQVKSSHLFVSKLGRISSPFCLKKSTHLLTPFVSKSVFSPLVSLGALRLVRRSL